MEDSWWRELFEKVLEGKARQPSTHLAFTLTLTLTVKPYNPKALEGKARQPSTHLTFTLTLTLTAKPYNPKALEGKARQPSTGFVALAVAVAVAQAAGAPAPSVYGFGTCTPCTKYYKCQPDDIWEEAQAQGTDDFEHP